MLLFRNTSLQVGDYLMYPKEDRNYFLKIIDESNKFYMVENYDFKKNVFEKDNLYIKKIRKDNDRVLKIDEEIFNKIKKMNLKEE